MSEIKRYIEVRDQIIKEAVAAAVADGNEDWQVAQNHAYAAALQHPLTKDDADEIAKEAGSECPF